MSEVDLLHSTAEPLADAYFAPQHHWCADARPASEFDYGFIGKPRMWNGYLRAPPGRPPDSRYHPPSEPEWTQPGLVGVTRTP